MCVFILYMYITLNSYKITYFCARSKRFGNILTKEITKHIHTYVRTYLIELPSVRNPKRTMMLVLLLLLLLMGGMTELNLHKYT